MSQMNNRVALLLPALPLTVSSSSSSSVMGFFLNELLLFNV